MTTNGIREATRTGRPYPIKGWFVYASNLLLTGLVMAFHLGSTTQVAACIFVHKILVAMVLMGLTDR